MTSPPYDGLGAFDIADAPGPSEAPYPAKARRRRKPPAWRPALRRLSAALQGLTARITGADQAQASSVREAANRQNLLLLTTLRWVAVIGQVTTIAAATIWLKLPLPLTPMACVVAALAAVNLVSLWRCLGRGAIRQRELFFGLLIDVAALTAQLYLTGGATNPFVSLFLVQIILGAVLLSPGLTWLLAAITAGCFCLLVVRYRELALFTRPMDPANPMPGLEDPRRWGLLVGFLLAAAIEVLFVTRIHRNLRQRDARLAELRQQQVEETHIVRMGLLASGAAHELGSPLATLSVIVSDWEKMPALAGDPELAGELSEMQAAVGRCKAILSRMLMAVGETRAENAERTTLVRFFDAMVEDWRAERSPARIGYLNGVRADAEIVADAMIKQALFNVFDNALEASPDWIGIEVALRDETVVVRVHDNGPGFSPDILARFGKPYATTKPRAGRGLGLFLVTNVLRKLGGSVSGANNPEGGATVTVRFPVGGLVLEAADARN